MGLNKSTWVFIQIAPALVIFLLAQYLGSLKKIELFYTYLYLFSWAPYLWVLDRFLLFRKGQSYFWGGLKKAKLKQILWFFAASTSFWLVFEVINFRLKNWFYIGLPNNIWIRWPGYALSYATVLPGILFLSEIIETYLPKSNPTPELLYSEMVGERWSLVAGMGMFLLFIAWPKVFFPLVWGSLFFILEPAVQFFGGHSLLQDWRAGRWEKTVSLLLAGLICGIFWEACNFGAGAKWQYNIPLAGFLKVFEMPLLGFIGFPVFALELFVMYQFSLKIWERMNPKFKMGTALGVLVFWAAAFWGIDQITVFIWRR